MIYDMTKENHFFNNSKENKMIAINNFIAKICSTESVVILGLCIHCRLTH